MALNHYKALVLGYDGKHIVENLTFDLNSGGHLCIVGEKCSNA